MITIAQFLVSAMLALMALGAFLMGIYKMPEKLDEVSVNQDQIKENQDEIISLTEDQDGRLINLEYGQDHIEKFLRNKHPEYTPRQRIQVPKGQLIRQRIR